MESSKLIIKTKFNRDVISSSIENNMDEITNVMFEKIIRLQDEGIRKALIELGWTPPEEEKTLKTLEESNAERRKIQEKNNPKYPLKNGIACPNCGLELYDSDPGILLSYPAQKNIHCDCGYKGYRIK